MRKYPQQSMRLLRGDDAASNQSVSKRREASTVAATNLKTPVSASSSLPTRSSASSAMVVKRKVDELFRRLQPQSLVQSMAKLMTTIRVTPRLFVNGEELLFKAPPAPTIAAAASQRSRRPTSTTAAWRFQPEEGRFRYGLSLQYTNSNPELNLSSLENVSVILTSTAMHTSRCLPLACSEPLTTKAWKLVAETDRRIGLALFELTLGDWGASSLIALVWALNREVARFFLQLNTTELLHSAPPRALQRSDDDLDRTHGLHSYTAAISLRSLDELYWECEVYHVEFLMPENGARSVSVQLLDNIHGGTVAARDRVLTSDTEPAFRLETEAVKYAMDNCLAVDFTLWDAECVPAWAFSRLLELKAASPQQQDEDADNIDLSVSSLGGTTRRMQMQFQDAARDNNLVVRLTKLSPSSTPQQSTKKATIRVNQVDLTLSLAFINSTFGTKY
ncbi:hypothetical protein F444_10308 [Phytophthora nicotianae P1976]|uniref:Uncharacterized protein n=1 Tax=Phytophthora nicotianae P1976 TaxID=1317066 RepID=A0A081A4F8_PHYNI|nr:hypothetical protein F444_10308 [Phytophthora nicotianae P1976]